MAPFCIEALDKGVEGGRGSCQKARFQRALALPNSGQQAGSLGEKKGGTSSLVGWFLGCSRHPSLS